MNVEAIIYAMQQSSSYVRWMIITELSRVCDLCGQKNDMRVFIFMGQCAT